MYWGGHVDASRIKVFRWRDAAARWTRRTMPPVNTWCKTDYDERSDSQQWLDNSRTSELHHWSRPQAVPGIGPAGRYAAE
jgi:hypothetical protein